MDREELMNILATFQEIIHQEKHSASELHEHVYNTCLVASQWLQDKYEEIDEEYIIDEELFEMLDHDRRFMAYTYEAIIKSSEEQ
jgi:hypothetical protein